MHDPDTITDPDWIDTVLRPEMYSKTRALIPLGTTHILMELLPFSPSYPNTTSGRGAMLMYFLADNSTGYVGALPPIQMTLSKRDPSTGKLTYNASVIHTGEADEQSLAKNQHLPCNPYPDFTQGEPKGLCLFPASAVEHPVRTEARNRVLDNTLSMDTDLPIETPNTVHMTPAVTQYTFVVITAYRLAHPRQVRKGPQHDGQLGFMVMNMQALELSKMFARQDVPADSLLYAVALNHWTGETGDLVAVNKYHLVTHYEIPFANWTRPQAQLLHVTNHTVDPNSTVLSPIARHGRSVMWERSSGYKGAANRTRDAFESWVDTAEAGNGTEYWFVTQEVSRADLVWYVSLLVPRGTVMASIDLSVAAIRTDSARSKQLSTEQQQDSYVLVACVMVGATVAMLVMSVLVSRLVTRPIEELRHAMERVAHMDLEAVESHGTSKISEVASMQRSFVAMVENLVEYRNYMPESLLLNEDVVRVRLPESDTDGYSTSISVTDRAERSDQDAQSRETRVSHPSASSSGGLEDAMCGIKRRSVAIICFNIKGWHAATDDMRDSDIVNVLFEVMTSLMTAVKTHGGIQDCFSGDRLSGAFNAFSVCGHHKTCAAQTSQQATREVRAVTADTALQLSFAIGSGPARIGHLGCPGMKRVTVLGHAVQFVCALESFNSKNCFTGVADMFAAGDMGRLFDVKQCGAVFCKKRHPKMITVFEFTEREARCQNAEWMYELEAMAESDPYAMWNATWTAVCGGNWEMAELQLRRIPQDVHDYAFLEQVVQRQMYTPQDLTYGRFSGRQV
eukprot:TRINITY_DN699_c0_g1_i2.p1 TRINITY_DN699_c0_g1~~TRINITY_DN699_c0_g1_i2.p1  ORF type:complete len:793 (+),score=209.52 TRINITY_DN699_c0_g1_i2:341-2719(+)